MNGVYPVYSVPGPTPIIPGVFIYMDRIVYTYPMRGSAFCQASPNQGRPYQVTAPASFLSKDIIIIVVSLLLCITTELLWGELHPVQKQTVRAVIKISPTQTGRTTDPLSTRRILARSVQGWLLFSFFDFFAPLPPGPCERISFPLIGPLWFLHFLHLFLSSIYTQFSIYLPSFV